MTKEELERKVRILECAVNYACSVLTQDDGVTCGGSCPLDVFEVQPEWCTHEEEEYPEGRDFDPEKDEWPCDCDYVTNYKCWQRHLKEIGKEIYERRG